MYSILYFIQQRPAPSNVGLRFLGLPPLFSSLGITNVMKVSWPMSMYLYYVTFSINVMPAKL